MPAIVPLLSLWSIALLATLVGPFLLGFADPGDAVTRWTVRLALACWAPAVALMLWLAPADWRGRTPRGRLARNLWTLGLVAYLVHLAAAFHYHHHWSHAAAIQHVHDRSGFGPGIFVSHAFTVVWTLDVLLWHLAPDRYAARPAWVGVSLHGLMAFIILNGTVIYETGIIRPVGGVLLAGLAVLTVIRLTWQKTVHPGH